MIERRHCRECGTELPAGFGGALCPVCALSRAERIPPIVPEVDSCDTDTITLHPVREFGDYELIEEIARGGMGVVYKARQKSLGRIVAIKMILFSQHTTVDVIKRFRGEASAAAALQHPHIVAIHEVGVSNGEHYLAMDFVNGRNLATITKECPLPPQKAAQYLQKISSAIDYAHQCHILHRDLKPSNVLIDAHDQPRITDFGLAKRIATDLGEAVEQSQLTLSGQFMGSPGYVSPEQAQGTRGKVGPRSDVYSLGAMLFHVLTGRPPFVGESLAEILGQVERDEPISPRLLNPAVPVDLETTCLKCLEKDPLRRYQSAAQLADDLGRFLRNEPILARPVGPVGKLHRWHRRNPHLSNAIAVAIVVFIVGFVTSVSQWFRAEERAAEAQVHLYVADMNLAHQAFRQNNRAYALDKLRSHIPNPGEPDLRGWEWRYLWNLCQPNDVRSIPGTIPITGLAWPPKYAWMATAHSDGNIRVRDYASTRLMTNLSAGPFEPSQKPVVVSPDGRLLALLDHSRIQLIDTANWQVQRILVPNRAGKLFSVAFFKSLMTTETTGIQNVIATDEHGLHTWSIESEREIASPVTMNSPCRNLAVSPNSRWLAVSTGNAVLAWDLTSRRQILQSISAAEGVSGVAISANDLLAISDREGSIQVWQLGDEPKQAHEWQAHPSTIFDLAFAPADKLLATAGSDQTVHLWSTTNWERLATFKGHRSEVWCLGFSSDGTKLVSGGKEGQIEEWNPAFRPVSDALPESTLPLWFATDGSMIGTLTVDRELQQWEVASRRLIGVARAGPRGKVEFLEITPDGQTLVARMNGAIHILDRQTAQSRGALEIDPTGLHRATPWECSPDSQSVAVGTERGTNRTQAIELFSLENRRRQRILPGVGWPLRFSRDGRLIAARNADGGTAIWDLHRGQLVRTLKPEAPVTSIALSPDSRLVATACSDHAIRLWRLESGKLASTLLGHQEGIGKIVFSLDGRTLFSSSTDDTVKLWNVATGNEMLSITDYGGDTFELRLSPDDRMLAVGGLDFRRQPVKLWRAPLLYEIDSALKFEGAKSRAH